MDSKNLQARLEQNIPLVKMMGCQILKVKEREVSIRAPLGPNINHVGTAFGGSQYSTAMLSCYALIVSVLETHDLLKSFDLVVKETSSRYRRPVAAEFIAHCQWPDLFTPTAWTQNLVKEGRQSIHLLVQIKSEQKVCSEFKAEFVAIFNEQKKKDHL